MTQEEVRSFSEFYYSIIPQTVTWFAITFCGEHLSKSIHEANFFISSSSLRTFCFVTTDTVGSTPVVSTSLSISTYPRIDWQSWIIASSLHGSLQRLRAIFFIWSCVTVIFHYIKSYLLHYISLEGKIKYVSCRIHQKPPQKSRRIDAVSFTGSKILFYCLYIIIFHQLSFSLSWVSPRDCFSHFQLYIYCPYPLLSFLYKSYNSLLYQRKNANRRLWSDCCSHSSLYLISYSCICLMKFFTFTIVLTLFIYEKNNS